MRTLIVSDLHLGSASRADVLRMPHARERLLSALAGVDRLVLLGDTLELRHGPRRDALAAARPFFEALGGEMAGREIVLLAGNHDHALVGAWLQRRAEREDPAPLRLEHRLTPAEASPMAERIAGWVAPARLSVAYPGLWVREDVYAIHGHYLDCHITVPTMERLAIALMGRLLRRPQPRLHSVDAYEAVTTPIYAWIDAVAAQGTTTSALNGSATVKMWRLLHHEDRDARVRRGQGRNGVRAAGLRGMLAGGVGAGLRSGAVRRGFPLAVAALNRASLGPLNADISGPELRRAALAAMGEVAARLDLRDAHVVFGHTHRAGPLPADDQREWRGRAGARLLNCGSWTYNSGFIAPGDTENPYWPGSCVVLDDAQPLREPELRRLLRESRSDQLVAG